MMKLEHAQGWGRETGSSDERIMRCGWDGMEWECLLTYRWCAVKSNKVDACC